ncbi:CvpA family protein [Ferruginibacter sp. HRS2-29]|uniref:CvpA family protein n=1 Tax=Ferruginibacter sp. HRS2-29 TaxID=2487334 RepID=UPI0020CFB10A|nr:CvpA family protein [Ferruginibacter sp. HRS2-29]MCP9750477.1 CvpA family protein [Ferruginibacter sp. HRS2-29]
MLIDSIFAVLLVLACIKGYTKGLIVALFSIIGFIVGLAAAIKLSSVVAEKLSASISVSAKWLPFISFLLVFIAVIVLVNLGAKLIQKSFEMAMLGWVNRLGGILLYMLLYSILLSIFLFYAIQLKFINDETVKASVIYPYIQPLGPKVINSLGFVIPWFRDMFTQLQDFFGNIPAKTN